MQELSEEAKALVRSLIEEDGYKAIDMIATEQKHALPRLREL